MSIMAETLKLWGGKKTEIIFQDEVALTLGTGRSGLVAGLAWPSKIGHEGWGPAGNSGGVSTGTLLLGKQQEQDHLFMPIRPERARAPGTCSMYPADCWCFSWGLGFLCEMGEEKGTWGSRVGKSPGGRASQQELRRLSM